MAGVPRRRREGSREPTPKRRGLLRGAAVGLLILSLFCGLVYLIRPLLFELFPTPTWKFVWLFHQNDPAVNFQVGEAIRTESCVAAEDAAEDALPYYRKAAEGMPENYEARFRLGWAYYWRGSPAAIPELRAARKRTHQTTEVDALLADALQKETAR